MERVNLLAWYPLSSFIMCYTWPGWKSSGLACQLGIILQEPGVLTKSLPKTWTETTHLLYWTIQLPGRRGLLLQLTKQNPNQLTKTDSKVETTTYQDKTAKLCCLPERSTAPLPPVTPVKKWKKERGLKRKWCLSFYILLTKYPISYQTVYLRNTLIK